MKRLHLVILAAALVVGACGGGEPPPPFKKLTSAGEYIEEVAGKPITFENGGVLITNRDGSIGGNFDGETPEGSWTFEDGKLCREVTIGSQSYPEVCHTVEVGREGDTVRFLNDDGTLSAEASLG